MVSQQVPHKHFSLGTAQLHAAHQRECLGPCLLCGVQAVGGVSATVQERRTTDVDVRTPGR